jgi:hypothetical protein
LRLSTPDCARPGAPTTHVPARRLAAGLALIALAAGAGTAAAHGPEKDGDSLTPKQIRAEIKTLRVELRASVKVYARGDAARTKVLVREAYIGHFEGLEARMERADEEFTEELEHDIIDDLTAIADAGKPVKAYRAKVNGIVARLPKAQKLLLRP